MYYQLIYISFAADKLSTEDLTIILERSKTNNIARNITGALLYHGGIFLQLLEGEEIAIKKLFDKIKNDKRHHGVTQIIETKTQTRLIPKVSLKTVNAQELDFETLNLILSFNKYRNPSYKLQINSDIAAEIFSSFVKICNQGPPLSQQ